jgi:hypothetical protein
VLYSGCAPIRSSLPDAEPCPAILTIAAAIATSQDVLVKGYLSVLDLSMMKEAWKLPSIQKKALGGSKPDKLLSQMTAAERTVFKDAQKEARENSELMLEMMQILPHAIHASLITSDDDDDNARLVWGALREEYLVTPANDITLAHGSECREHGRL